MDPPTSDPLSDPDPYGDSQHNSNNDPLLPTYHIRNLPQPNAIITAFTGVNATYISHGCSFHTQRASQILHRPPTQSEAEALAQHFATALVITAYGFPLGAAGGLFRAYSTRKTYRFPFRTPDPKTFNPARFAIFGMTLLEGWQSRFVWQCSRGIAYSIGIGLLGQFISSIAGVWRLNTGERRDVRLKAFIEAKRELKKIRVAERMDRMKGAGSIDNKDAGEVLRSSREAQTQDVRRQRSIQKQETVATPDWDDASPSAAGWGNEVSEPVAEDLSLSSAPVPDTYSRRRVPTQRPANLNTEQKSQQKADQERYGASADSLLSDLTTPGGKRSSAPPSSTGRASSSESAWARIRRQNSASNSDSEPT